MKILYALPATGYGHISRASVLLPELQAYGEVDILVSGTQSNQLFSLKPKYRLKGISLFYSKGSVDYLSTWNQLSLFRMIKDITGLRVHDYDMVISDFEPVSYWACRLRGIKFLHWGHQASFYYDIIPAQVSCNRLDRLILTRYVISDLSLGIQFRPHYPHITPPVISESIMRGEKLQLDLITAYLPQFTLRELITLFQGFKGVNINLFHPSISGKAQLDNIYLFPVDRNSFDESLRFCRLCICSAGFETPSEILTLGKKLIVLPVKNHLEQKMNAIALKQLGVTVFEELHQLTHEIIYETLESESEQVQLEYKSPAEHVLYAMNYWKRCMDMRRDGLVPGLDGL